MFAVICVLLACGPQDLAAGADADDPLPDPCCLHLSVNTAALADIRARATQHTQQDIRQQSEFTTATPAASSAAARGASLTATATGGLWRCVSEWAGLSCRHSGTWQLSLLYDTQELHKFSLVSGSGMLHARPATSTSALVDAHEG